MFVCFYSYDIIISILSFVYDAKSFVYDFKGFVYDVIISI